MCLVFNKIVKLITFLLFVTAIQHKKVRLYTNLPHIHTRFCKASSHQGNPTIFHPNSVGRQCLPNSLIACAMAAIMKPSTWTTETMDYILQEGDKLYRSIDIGHELLLPSDLPHCVHVKDTVCEIVRGKEAYGSFVENEAQNKKNLVALCTFLEKTKTSALLCIGDSTGSSAITLLSMDTSICVFDAHSRNHNGMPCPNGNSVLMHFDHIEDTVSYICELAHMLSGKLFHWTFWHALPHAE